MVQNKKSFRSRKYKWPLLFLGLIVILGLGFGIYSKIALELNKRAFEQARVAIDEIYADIVGEVGQPDNFRRESECSKSYSGPYNEELGCGVHTDFTYSVGSKQEADSHTEKIRMIVNKYSDELSPIAKPDSGIVVTIAPGDPDTNTSFSYYRGPGGLLCIFKYVYDDPEQIYLELPKSVKGNPFYVTSGCSGSALKLHYPKQSDS